MTPPATRTATSIARDVRAGRTTARAETEAALARIAVLDGQIGAFQVVRHGRALAEADAVDARPDRFSLPLAGVSVAIKDNVPVEGEPMRNGSLATSALPQPTSHEVVRRLRRAGAVVVGLTRVPELCVFGTTDSPFGITRNPLDPELSPGGSSGGSAAAVAAGMVAVAHGNDGMGSLRIPAACCGIVGVKPGLGRVPADLGNGSWFDMAENGALATTVADAALVLSVLADDPTLAAITVPTGLRIAVGVQPPGLPAPVHPAYVEAARTAGDLLRTAGHDVRAQELRISLDTAMAALARWFAGTALEVRSLSQPSRLSRRTRRHAAVGEWVLRTGGPRLAPRTSWERHARRFFADNDVLITPALAQPPKSAVRWAERGWLANLVTDTRYAPFAAPWNLAGWPALTVPLPTVRAPHGPAAVQLIAPRGHEARLLAVAGQLELLAAG